MDAIREMRLELIQGLFGLTGTVTPVGDGELVARADFMHEDEKYITPSSFNVLGMRDQEITYIFSGGRLDAETFRRNFERAVSESEGLIVRGKKLRSATTTAVMIYDSADQGVLDEVRSNSIRINHKLGFGGWTVRRAALILTDTGEVVTDRRGTKELVGRLRKIAELR